MNDALEALETFLGKTLALKKERYLGFIAKKKNQKKFLHTIYHELEGCFDAAKKVEGFSEDILALPGYLFKPPKKFGEPIDSIKSLLNCYEESFLVVTTDGKYGIHGPESVIDDRAFYIAR